MEGAEYVKSLMRPLVPLPTGLEPQLPPLPGISTVVFDVYGTLLISAAGDVGGPGRDESGRLAMAKVNELLEGAFTGSEEAVAHAIVNLLEEALSGKRAEGVAFPEVDIRTIWTELFKEYAPGTSERLIDKAALEYECRMNPVWEMPGAVNLIRWLAESGITMGIISNAQDYTHSVFAGVMGGSFEALGFDPDLMVFSYEEGEGKPSLALYHKMRERLEKRGVAPDTVLYVGNDMTKDVLPAAEVGFRTCLFAGDDRSLRSGGFSGDEVGAIADAVVTDLKQIGDLLK
ncbi:MAG: HAD family hydrolase [Verrucomicrobiales bacterium]|nr:HAD family hydrolase [Verrucomicrobiales bacterium]